MPGKLRGLLGVLLVCLWLFPSSSCGGSRPSTPTTLPTPELGVPAGTVLTLISGETDRPVAGAHVVAATRAYDADASGQVSLAEPVAFGSPLDVTAPGFLDRQTVIRKDGPRRLVLWPSATSFGVSDYYTSQLIYTYASSDPPPRGSSPLQRIRPGVSEAVVVLSEGIRQDTAGHTFHLTAVANLNDSLAGRVRYVVSPTKPATGVVFEVQVDPSDSGCDDSTYGFARLSYQGGEITGGKVVYCQPDRMTLSLITHELGHTMGLEHSFVGTDVMFFYYNARNEMFSPAEELSLRMLLERPAGNRFPDSDRNVTPASSGVRTIVCR